MSDTKCIIHFQCDFFFFFGVAWRPRALLRRAHLETHVNRLTTECSVYSLQQEKELDQGRGKEPWSGQGLEHLPAHMSVCLFRHTQAWAGISWKTPSSGRWNPRGL